MIQHCSGPLHDHLLASNICLYDIERSVYRPLGGAHQVLRLVRMLVRLSVACRLFSGSRKAVETYNLLET